MNPTNFTNWWKEHEMEYLHREHKDMMMEEAWDASREAPNALINEIRRIIDDPYIPAEQALLMIGLRVSNYIKEDK